MSLQEGLLLHNDSAQITPDLNQTEYDAVEYIPSVHRLSMLLAY